MTATTDPAASAYFCPRCGTRTGAGGACERDHTQLVAITVDSLLGTEVGHYVLVERLGEGGMGAVYRAVQPAIGAEVAIKVLHASTGDQAQRFLLEAQAVNRVRHPNLVRVLDTGYLVDRRPYLVMELLDGISLADAVGRIAPGVAVRIATEVLDTLDAVHREGIVHRDLKPPNVFLAVDGRVVVLDFGIAKLVDGPAITHSSGMVGTPEYMAPEQIRAQAVDRRTDVYAIGVMLYETITGRRPFAAVATFDMLVQHLEQPPVSPREYAPNLSQDVADTILRAMEKRPEQRFQTAAEMAAALRTTTSATRDDLVAFVATRAKTRPPLPVSRPAESATADERPQPVDVATRRESPGKRASNESVPQPTASRPRRMPWWLPHVAIAAALAAIAAFVILRREDTPPTPVSAPGVATSTPDAAPVVLADAAAPPDASPVPVVVGEAPSTKTVATGSSCDAVVEHGIILVKNEWRRLHGEAMKQSDVPEVASTLRKNCVSWSAPMRACVMKAKTLAASQECECLSIARHATDLITTEVRQSAGTAPSKATQTQVYDRLVTRCRSEWSTATRACIASATTATQAAACGPVIHDEDIGIAVPATSAATPHGTDSNGEPIVDPRIGADYNVAATEGRNADAIELARRALARNPANDNARQIIAVAACDEYGHLSSLDPKAAERYKQIALDTGPKLSGMYLRLAEAVCDRVDISLRAPNKRTGSDASAP